MATTLSLDQHRSALETSGNELAEFAASAGESAKVPTCPTWDVGTLVAHQSMVHRWATCYLTGSDPEAVSSQSEILGSISDLAGHYSEGLQLLLAAIDTAPAELDAPVFLNNTPAPRELWARRQAHETTVHRVDALSALLGRLPTTSEAILDRDLALDGIDELLTGFFTRGRSKLFDGETFTILVAPADSDRRWSVHVAEQLRIEAEASRQPLLTIGGLAASIYLGLWNRGDEVLLDGDVRVMDRWQTTQRVLWRGSR